MDAGEFSYKEFMLWESWLEMFPGGHSDLDTARIQATIAAVNRRKDSPALRAVDFMRGKLPKEKPPQTADEFVAKLKANPPVA